jgi:hypothetical protein
MMKKLALILLAGASLLGTAGIAAAQYYYDRPGYGDPYRGRYYDDRYYQRRGYAYGGAIVGLIDTAGENCITRLDEAVGVRRTTQSKTAFANLIAATEFVCE